MKKGDKCTLTTPWHDTPQEGKIIEVFETKVGNYYVVEFDDGTKWTAKESDIVDKPSEAIQLLLNRSKNETKDFCSGYIHALYVEGIIGSDEWLYYDHKFEKEKK